MQVLTAQQPAPVETNEQIFARVYSQVSRGSAPPKVVCLLKPYVNTMGKLHLAAGTLEVRLHEMIASAPATVREALAWILVSKLFRKHAPPHFLLHYRQYMNRKDVRHTHQAVRRVRGRKFVSGPQGGHYDLDAIYLDLQARYFHPLMPKPLLGWSRRPSRTLLGHFDSAHNAIILSSILDRPSVPLLAVEYVLYHEMLHLQHPVEHRGSRRRVHTRDFLAAEKLFLGLKEAKEMLKKL